MTASAGSQTGVKMGSRRGSAAAVRQPQTWLAKNAAHRATRDTENADAEN